LIGAHVIRCCAADSRPVRRTSDAVVDERLAMIAASMAQGDEPRK
jgi:hypothetical protein